MRLHNSNERYGLGPKLLHWALAISIIGLIGLGWYRVNLTYYDRWYNTSLAVHKALGLIVLLLAAVKLAYIQKVFTSQMLVALSMIRANGRWVYGDANHACLGLRRVMAKGPADIVESPM
jgi:cytochrome b561